MNWGTRHRRMVVSGPVDIAETLLLWILYPCGLLYGLVGRLRVWLYRSGWLTVYRAEVPVVSVGNLAVGGTGKTPVVDLILKWCLARGIKVAVVSRGYGGTFRGRVGVVSLGAGPRLSARECGDEPFLLAWRNPAALVFIARRRSDGIRLAVEQHGAALIVLDDGFQHLAVARDLDLVLLDGRYPLGNGLVLPAGLLREVPAALQRADLLVLTRCATAACRAPVPFAGPTVVSRHALDTQVISLAGETLPLAALTGRRGVAFAGIADPGSFFAALTAQGLELAVTIPLPDHVVYDAACLTQLAAAAQQGDYLITTEKDAVKLAAAHFAVPCYRIPMSVQFYDDAPFYAALHNLISKVKS